MEKNAKFSTTHILLVCFVALLSLVVLLPFVWMMSLSLKSNSEIISGSISIIPKQVSLDGFRSVMEKMNILVVWFKNSVIVTISVVTLSLFTSSLGGYIFAKFHFKGRNLIFIMILAGLMVPFQVTMVPVYLIIKELGLIDNLLAVILPAIVSPFGIFLCKQYIELIPSDFIEAARIDGAGEFYTFFKLIIPQIVPALSAQAIFSFISTWNDYLWPLIVLNGEDKMTIPLSLTVFSSEHSTDYNATMAAAFIVILPSIILFIIFQNQFIKGTALSGIK